MPDPALQRTGLRPRRGSRPLSAHREAEQSKMFWFMICATRKSGAETLAEAPEAYVSCWINFAIREGAELLARHYIDKAGWTPGAIEDACWVEEDDHAGRPELQYFREAAKDGASLVFHTFPADDAPGNPA